MARTDVLLALLLICAALPLQLAAQSPGGEDVPERLPPPMAEPPPLGLEDVERISLANNPSLVRAAASVEGVRGEWLQAGLYRNPTVGIGEQQTGSGGRAEQPNVSWSQEFVMGGKLRLSREVASRQIAQAEHEFAAQQLRVLTDTRIAFFSVVVAQRRRLLAGELVNIAQRGVDAAIQHQDKSDVGENDVLEARVELHRAEIDARKALNRLTSAWRSLTAVSGVPNLPLQELAADLEPRFAPRTWQETRDAILRSSPEVAAASANLDRTKAALARANVEKIPNITFDGLVNWRDNGIGGRPDGGFLVSVPLPTWDRNQGGVQKARADIVSAERAIALLELDIQNRLAPVYERYENAQYTAAQFRNRILPSAARALDMTRRNYEGGKADYDDLLTSQRTNAQANLDYLDALLELWKADAEIRGLTLSESLKASP